MILPYQFFGRVEPKKGGIHVPWESPGGPTRNGEGEERIGRLAQNPSDDAKSQRTAGFEAAEEYIPLFRQVCMLMPHTFDAREFIDAEDRLYLRSISYAIRGTNAVQNLTKQGLTNITAC